jgi:uncharacterized protein YbjT (DUF2867 family)
VRCLVRDPRRLGDDRVRVALALGDLTDPPSFRNALRGVSTVVHLAQARRDQPRGSIEEVNAIATWRLVEAAERAGARRFVLLSDLRASPTDRTRFRRSKAAAEAALLASGLQATVLAPSFVLPGPPWRVPIAPGRSRTTFEPVTAGDVAEAAFGALDGGPARIELRGAPMGRDEVVARMAGRAPVRVPTPLAHRGLRAAEWLLGPRTPVSWDELELLV